MQSALLASAMATQVWNSTRNFAPCVLCLPDRLHSSLTYLVTGTSGKAHPGLDLDSLPLPSFVSFSVSQTRAQRDRERKREMERKWETDSSCFIIFTSWLVHGVSAIKRNRLICFSSILSYFLVWVLTPLHPTRSYQGGEHGATRPAECYRDE